MNIALTHQQRVAILEREMASHPKAEIVTNHYFAEGTYTREILIPAGTLLTGKLHRFSCINILAKGKIKVVTDEGEYDVEAPYTFVSGAGVKKVGYVLEDAVWINVHPWDGKMNLQEIEQVVIEPELAALGETICLG
jgi:hypothetical protein